MEKIFIDPVSKDLYYSNSVTGEIRKATSEEHDQFAKDLTKTLNHLIASENLQIQKSEKNLNVVKKTRYLLYVIWIASFISAFKYKGYSLPELSMIAIKEYQNPENKKDIYQKAIEERIQKNVYDAKDYQIIYDNFLNQYIEKLSISDLLNINELTKNKLYNILKLDNLVSDCIETLRDNSITGNLRLAIICDILGEDQTIPYLLTDHEEKVWNSLKTKLALNEKEWYQFCEDLEQLNQMSNGEISDINISPKTREIIRKFTTKPLIKAWIDIEQKTNFVPAGSYLATNEYPVLLKENVLSKTSLLVNTSLDQQSEIEEEIARQKEALFSKYLNLPEDNSDPILCLLSILEKTSITLNTNNQESYQINIKKAFINRGIYAPDFIIGLKDYDPKALKVYVSEYVMDQYFQSWEPQNIYEINYILAYLRKAQIERRKDYKEYENIINHLIQKMTEVLESQKQEEYISLIGKEMIFYTKFLPMKNQREWIPYVFFHIGIGSMYKETNQKYIVLEIPVAEENCQPIIKVTSNKRDCQYQLSDFEYNDEITQNSGNSDMKYYIMPVKPQEEFQYLNAYIRIEDYLTLMKKDYQRKKEKVENDM